MFELFDPTSDYVVRRGSLPHWYQPGVTCFVTFRSDDSVPRDLARSWYGRREHWLRVHGLDPASPHWKAKLQEDPQLEKEFSQTFTREFMEYLDRGYGECLLRDPELAEIVANALRHFDGTRYWLGDFIVMPNHVHAIVCMLGSTELQPQCDSWKSYTARAINRKLGRKGRFWQAESFDHLVRSPDQFDYLRRYIAENPEKAKLEAGDYLHWVREM